MHVTFPDLNKQLVNKIIKAVILTGVVVLLLTLTNVDKTPIIKLCIVVGDF